MCNGLISATVGLSATKMGLSLRMVIGVVTNGVVGAVANGSQRLGLGLGSERREWCCRSRREWFATIGFGFWAQTVANGVVEAIANGSRRLGLSLGSDRREWCCRTVANGFAGPSQLVIGNGSGVIGDGEARQRLCLSSIGFWFLKNHN